MIKQLVSNAVQHLLVSDMKSITKLDVLQTSVGVINSFLFNYINSRGRYKGCVIK